MSPLTQILERLFKDLEADTFTLSVNGSSMKPAIVKGDRIWIQRIKENEEKNLKIGEIVICQSVSRQWYIHRLIEVHPKFKTKGDATSSNDEEILKIWGRVSRVEKNWRSRLRRLTMKVEGLYK